MFHSDIAKRIGIVAISPAINERIWIKYVNLLLLKSSSNNIELVIDSVELIIKTKPHIRKTAAPLQDPEVFDNSMIPKKNTIIETIKVMASVHPSETLFFVMSDNLNNLILYNNLMCLKNVVFTHNS
ncbi:MAG: hypothetical protein ACI9N1_001971 [Flavobacteriales bacterium]|jgi:hypothetical protein